MVRMEFPCVVLWRPEALDCRVLIPPEAWSCHAFHRGGLRASCVSLPSAASTEKGAERPGALHAAQRRDAQKPEMGPARWEPKRAWLRRRLGPHRLLCSRTFCESQSHSRRRLLS